MLIYVAHFWRNKMQNIIICGVMEYVESVKKITLQ